MLIEKIEWAVKGLATFQSIELPNEQNPTHLCPKLSHLLVQVGEWAQFFKFKLFHHLVKILLHAFAMHVTTRAFSRWPI